MFQGQVVFITGASSGIGEALALELARHAAKLALFARRRERLDEVAHAAERAGAEAVTVLPGDVREPESVATAVRKAQSAWGRIDVAFLSAGVGQPTTLRTYNMDRMRETVETNLMGVVYATGALLPVFRRQGSGLLVGISSLADGRGSPLNLAYCASKAGMTRFLEGVRAGCAEDGIRVVVVKPGFVRTPMSARNRFPMPFLVEPDDAARRILAGVRRNRAVIRFPLPMACLVAVSNRLPGPLYDLLTKALMPSGR
jgi:NAD(P)-dependent dehydrogenase (short-subunit alcohol dehydrogenase family)